MSDQPSTPTVPADPAGRTVADGDRVISWNEDQPVVYGGESDGTFDTLSFGVFSGATPVLKCDPRRVAPADTPIPDRDERVSVVKGTRAEMPYGAAGVWQLRLPGDKRPSWHRTKRDATTTGLRRLAILDWHAGTVPPGAVPAGPARVRAARHSGRIFRGHHVEGGTVHSRHRVSL